MANMTLAAASYAKQKYFIEPKFLTLPEEIQKEIKILCVLTAQKLCCTFLMEFEEDGSLSFQTVQEDGVFDFDEIGAALEIKKIQTEQKELLKALQLWYVLFCTEEGKQMQEEWERRDGK